MPRDMGDGEAADEAVRAVDADVVLIAERRHRDLAGDLAAHPRAASACGRA